MPSQRRLAILVFDDVEVLDFAGPFEVFSVAGRDRDPRPFDVRLVAEHDGPVTTRGGLRVLPDYTLAGCPEIDVLIVPGGYGTRREMHNAGLIGWVRDRAARAELVASVCTGSLVLAKSGLLDGAAATTHHLALDLLRMTAPAVEVREGERFLDNGKVITSAGIAAGIDMSLHVVSRFLGQAVAEETARYMEYPWRPAKE